MTRKDFLKGSLGAALIGVAGPSAAKTPPKLRGTLWWYDPAQSRAWGESGWRDELDRQRRLGFDLLWLSNTAAALGDGMKDFRTLVSLCERRGVKLILDTSSSPGWYAALDLKAELALVGGHIRAISRAIGASSAFWAWYIPHEIYFCEGSMDRYIRALYPAVVHEAREALPDKPVTVSPFFILDKTRTFGDFKVPGENEYRDYWSSLLKVSKLDIVMLQDSAEHFAWVTNSQRRPYFRAMQAACKSAGAALWGNVECAEMNFASLEDYVKVNGRVHHSRGAEPRWRMVPIDRMASKLWLAAEFCPDFVTWGYQQFCSGDAEAARQWRNQYRAYTRQQV